MDKKTRLIYKNDMHGQEVSVACSWDADINEVGSTIYSMLLAAGYAHESIAEILDVEDTEETRNAK